MDLEKNSANDPVKEFLDELYNEIMKMRFELVDQKRMGNKDIADKEAKVESIQAEYDQIAKMYKNNLALNKKSGGGSSNNFMGELIKLIQETKSNTGDIVGTIPSR